ncbi:regulatory protein RecX [Pseudonocardia zijingensis]|uniref:regulatory protein RecX n=2 Tax=Pseudonocardia zijingensis TaxID=153376 RepID=UPI0036229A27
MARDPEPEPGRVARLDGLDAPAGEGAQSAPVARFGELLAAGTTPEPVDGSPVPVGPADLGRIGRVGSASAAPVADLDEGNAEPAAPGVVALFDSPAIGAGRDDVEVAELGPGALNRAARAGRRRGTRPAADRDPGRRDPGRRDLDRDSGRDQGRDPGRDAGRPDSSKGPGDDQDTAERRGARRRRGARLADASQPAELVEVGHAPETTEPGHPAAEDGRSRKRPRGRRGRGPEELDPDADPVAVAREVCLRLLTDRARTRKELAQALRRKGVPDDAAHTVLERFDEVGLIDDAAFAGQWVRSRHNHRGLARRAIAMELRRKGVSDEDAGEALAEVDAESEERRARELVDRKLRTLAVGTAEQRAAAGRRLVGMLARKGYGAGTAYRVVKEALAERGAEIDELGEGEVVDD